MTIASFPDFERAGNISGDPDLYLVENLAIDHSGQLDEALYEAAPWHDQVIVDVGCGTGFWLTEYALLPGQVIGVEPDPELYEVALADHHGSDRISVLHGSAEHFLWSVTRPTSSTPGLPTSGVTTRRCLAWWKWLAYCVPVGRS